jgi:diamine N-acetyltransferase
MIQALNTNDIPAIIEVCRPVWFETYEPILEKVQVEFMFEMIYNPASLQQQMDEGQQFLGYFEDKQLIGFISTSATAPAEIKVNKLYVSVEHKGSGIGKKLLNFIEQKVQEEQVNQIIINVNRFNPALFFYKAMGYAILRKEDIPIGNYWMNDYVVYKSFATNSAQDLPT